MLVAAPASHNAVVAAAVLVGGGVVVVVTIRGADEVTATARVNPHGNPIDAKINTKDGRKNTKSPTQSLDKIVFRLSNWVQVENGKIQHTRGLETNDAPPIAT